MYINRVLSHNGGWGRLKDEHPEAWQDLGAIITSLKIEGHQRDTRPTGVGRGSALSTPLRDFHTALRQSLKEKGWLPHTLPMTDSLHQRHLAVDGVREAIGIEIAFGKYQFVESVLFVEYPILFSAGLIAIGIVIMPTGDLVQQLVVQREFQSGVSRIEMVQDRLIALAPLPQKYPFVVLGISSNESSQHVTEMTSALDQYLMRYIGLSLMEMALEKERSKYDFKVVLPTENVKIAKLASAFANHTGGGWVLLGVDDEGTPVGILRCDLDAIQQRITNIIRDSCSPRPECCFEVIEMPRDPTKCILIVHIAELERKPCLVEHRAYVRRGTESVAADSEEIRRLIVREG